MNSNLGLRSRGSSGDKLLAPIAIGLNAVIVAVTKDSPRILTVQGVEHSLAKASDLPALPFGPLEPEQDRTLEKALRGWVRRQSGLELGYVEQLYTFGDRNRDPLERAGGSRVISIAYVALVREEQDAVRGSARWLNWYRFLPWEDWRSGPPRLIEQEVIPRLERWSSRAPSPSSRDRRRERVAICFGRQGATWDNERVLDRYELLYEAGLVEESNRDRKRAFSERAQIRLDRSMVLDHRRMIATALGRIRGKIRYRPVVFELLPPIFTLLQLQRVVEALIGGQLHKQNFRRLVDRGGLVEGTGELDRDTGGRPAELFRFRREVLRERTAPGVIPGA